MRTVLLSFWLVLFGFLAPAVQAADDDYVLASGDVVHITVYDHPDLATDIRVGADGEINFPLIGNIKLGGMALRKAESEIADRLDKGGFIRDPQVNINITQYRGHQVNVLGYVNHPGRFQLEKSSTVSDMLATAQGIAVTGADEVILIHRDGKNTTRTKIDAIDLMEKGDPTVDTELKDGDVLFVPREPRYYIYGEVQRPGTFRVERNMTVVQALSVGGGLTPRGTQRGIRILRRDEQGKTQEINAKLEDPVEPNDVIYVKESLF
jgi:polysaccharide biosynthesis/export protein